MEELKKKIDQKIEELEKGIAKNEEKRKIEEIWEELEKLLEQYLKEK